MLVKMIGIHFLWKCVWILGHSLTPHLFHALALAPSLNLGTIQVNEYKEYYGYK
jgi:hypothetical protein